MPDPAAEPTPDHDDPTVAALRLIAFYLPQFHPIPENDRWWGKGFTEWTNVASARPLFPGHHQPHIPADLGFYDLRLPEARQAQADLARAYGIHGFCYYHYWFNGQRLLERPFNEVLSSGEPDFPFCLCWANESWSRRWLGEEKSILQKQEYSPEDDLNHIRWLIPAFGDPRYIRIDGRPLFLIYRPKDLPDPAATIARWRQECERHGVPVPYLVGVDAHAPGMDMRTLGFDSTLAFQPQLGCLPEFMKDGWSPSRLGRNLKLGIANGRTKVYDAGDLRRRQAMTPRPFPHIRSVFVSWDNSPRRGPDGIVVTGCSPAAFGQAVAGAVQQVRQDPVHGDLLFINAWNEWAEGNHLEPDLENGRQYLQQLQEAVGRGSSAAPTQMQPPAPERSPLFRTLRWGVRRLRTARSSPRILGHMLRRGANLGYCPICQRRTVFYHTGAYNRGHYRCVRCQSIPRWRALIDVLETQFPHWRSLRIHESSPSGPASAKIARECHDYQASCFFPDVPPGKHHQGFRCENLEAQTFADGSFDLVVTQDVFEHIMDPAAAFREIARTLKPGGAHVFTVPWFHWKPTLVRAVMENGAIRHLEPPDYHGNPIDPSGSLVVTEWGPELMEFIERHSGLKTTFTRFNDRARGLEAEFLEVFVSRKSPADGTGSDGASESPVSTIATATTPRDGH